jgi:hypothetical protein
MIRFAEEIFKGIWKSYKIFYYHGGIKFHSRKLYQVFDFGGERILSILLFHDLKKTLVKQTTHWTIELKNKKNFLLIEKGKLCYEIVTVNHVDMVLDNKIIDEKIFFARPERWEDMMKLTQLSG